MKRLSYIIATRNKLPYLRVLVDRLVELVRDDEEIILVDGQSTDGTAEYGADLGRSGRVHQFISEPDHCQAHAYNKGILRSQGKYFKLLTDDDVYHLPSLRKCVDFMDKNPQVDVICGNTMDVRSRGGAIHYDSRPCEEAFHRWNEDGPAFWFGDQGLIIRRASLPIVGLMDTGVWCIDVELSVRLTSLRQASLAWYSGVVACSVINAASLSVSEFAKSGNDREVKRVFEYYGQIAHQRWLMRNPEKARVEEIKPKTMGSSLRESLRPRTRAKALLSFFRDGGKSKSTGESEDLLCANQQLEPVEHSRDPEKAKELEHWMTKLSEDNEGVFYLDKKSLAHG